MVKDIKFVLAGFQYRVDIRAKFGGNIPEVVSDASILDTGCSITTISLYLLTRNKV